MSIVESTPPETSQGGGAQPQRRGLLMRPGLIRGAWCFAVFFLVGLYLVAGVRWLAGWDPVYDWSIIVLVGALIPGRSAFCSASAPSTTGSTGSRGGRLLPRIIQVTARIPGRTISGSTPITR